MEGRTSERGFGGRGGRTIFRRLAGSPFVGAGNSLDGPLQSPGEIAINFGYLGFLIVPLKEVLNGPVVFRLDDHSRYQAFCAQRRAS